MLFRSIREEFDTIEEDELLVIETELAHLENKAMGEAMGGRA